MEEQKHENKEQGKKGGITPEKIDAVYKVSTKAAICIAVAVFAAFTAHCLIFDRQKAALLIVLFMCVVISVLLCFGLKLLHMVFVRIAWIKRCCIPVSGKVIAYAQHRNDGEAPVLKYRIKEDYRSNPLPYIRIPNENGFSEPYRIKLARKYPIGAEAEAYVDPDAPDRISARMELYSGDYILAVIAVVAAVSALVGCMFIGKFLLMLLGAY